MPVKPLLWAFLPSAASTGRDLPFPILILTVINTHVYWIRLLETLSCRYIFLDPYCPLAMQESLWLHVTCHALIMDEVAYYTVCSFGRHHWCWAACHPGPLYQPVSEEGTIWFEHLPKTPAKDCSLCYCPANGTGASTLGQPGSETASTPNP
jgi:hypothetical protein